MLEKTNNFDELKSILDDMKKSVVIQAQEIVALRVLIKQEIELLKIDNREIHTRLNNLIASLGEQQSDEQLIIDEQAAFIPQITTTPVIQNPFDVINQMREDIRAFIAFCENPYSGSRLNDNLYEHLFKKLKSHIDD